MCGIAGLIIKNLTEDNIAYFSNNLICALEHRGPDDSGIWFDKQCGVLLSHRRLAIQDLSPLGAQPMHSSSGRYSVVFNGEIYNYLELRTELASRGHFFRSNSDTEVLLASIEEWGLKNAVMKFIGMFAFGLWDKNDKVLHLCRDRIGEKPLYYGMKGGNFYFASELCAIESVCDPNTLTISTTGLYNFLKYGYIASPHSIYQEINKLPPGCILTLPLHHLAKGGSGLQIENYWSLQNAATTGLANQIEDFNDAVEMLNNRLQDVIKRQLIADVNVGLFLSGGIDSTTVTAIAQTVSPQQIKTFTIGYTEKDYDESVYASEIAHHLNTDHTTLYISPDEAKAVIPNLAEIYSEPFADSSQIPAYLVSKLAREHVTVCLSGDGGDELFAGYNRYLLTNRIWQNINALPFFARKTLSKLIQLTPDLLLNSMIAAVYKNKQGSIQSKIQKLTDLLQSRSILSAYDILSSYWPNPNLILKQNEIIKDTTIHLPQNANFIEQAMFIDQIRYLEGDNLAKTDRASMAVSLETRLPLLSHDVIELAWKIPLHMKVHNNISKWILRNVLYKYVPPSMVNRPKMGFSVPIADWLRGELKPWAEDLFNLLKDDAHLEPRPILEAWNEHKLGRADHANKLWTVLMFLAWRCNKKNLPISTP